MSESITTFYWACKFWLQICRYFMKRASVFFCVLEHDLSFFLQQLTPTTNIFIALHLNNFFCCIPLIISGVTRTWFCWHFPTNLFEACKFGFVQKKSLNLHRRETSIVLQLAWPYEKTMNFKYWTLKLFLSFKLKYTKSCWFKLVTSSFNLMMIDHFKMAQSVSFKSLQH